MCDGVDVALDLSALTRSGCLVHRPGYKCDGEPVHYHYAPGAIGGSSGGGGGVALGFAALATHPNGFVACVHELAAADYPVEVSATPLARPTISCSA
jgi:hypothetical protein